MLYTTFVIFSQMRLEIGVLQSIITTVFPFLRLDEI